MTAAPSVVHTVAGPIDPSTLGRTSMHEHLWMDSTPLLEVHGYRSDAALPAWDAAVAAEARWNPGVHPDNYRLTDESAAIEEVAAWAAAGGGTLVDLTPPSLGRDPEAVRRVASAAGVHAVVATGQYLGPAHEPWVAATDDAGIADRLIRDLTEGIAETGIRAGILGELGTSDPLRPEEARVLRASAAASRATGAAISVHVHPWGHEGPGVLDTLVLAGAAPERVILGHLTTAIDRPDELRRMADRGATLGIDLFGFDHSLLGPGRWPPSDRDVALAIAALVRDGYGDRIVLGHDVGVRTRYRRWGGWGYDHLLRHVVPLLGEVGVDGAAIDAMLVTTPARLLAVPA
jgi:phosphotriesterase-related protein